MGSAALEHALSVLHEGLIATSPPLLPAFRQLFDEIQRDRAHSIQQRAALLGLTPPTQSAVRHQQQLQQSVTSSRLSAGRPSGSGSGSGSGLRCS